MATTFKHYKVGSIGYKMLLSLIFVASSFAWAYAVVLQKKLLHIKTLTIIFYMGIEYMVVSGLICVLGVVPPISASSFL